MQKKCGILERMEYNLMHRSEKTAVDDGKETLTYWQLHTRAGRISKEIFTRVHGGHSAVGIVVEDSVDTVAAILGVLYSGNYYVPLDRTIPGKKFSEIIQETDMKLLLANDVPDSWEAAPACIAYSRTDDGNEGCYLDRKPEDVLYTVFTSGSTGKPKMICKSGRTMQEYLITFSETFGLDEEEIIGNQCPFFSDASAKDIYLTIYLGATMVILPRTYFAVPYKLIEFMNQKKITFISWVPSAYSFMERFDVFRMIVPQYLRMAFFVGEQMPVPVIRYWRKWLPGVRFFNTYGMSEMAGVCAYYEVREAWDGQNIPIGIPFANCKLILLDEQGRIAEKGELAVQAPTLAEELPLVSVTEPSGESGNYFRTGDLAYRDGDGNYVLTGRRDFQIKHRGYRIHLEEVEAILRMAEEIGECACFYDADTQKMVAALELKENAVFSRGELFAFCRKNLSRFMIPDEFWNVPSIPHNRSGKVDRISLAEAWKKKNPQF